MDIPKRVLCGTDFLDAGTQACDLAGKLAQALGAEVVLVHAADVAVLTNYADSPGFSTVAQRAMRKRIQERLDSARSALAAEQNRLAAHGAPEVTIDLREGRPWKAIVGAAKENPGLIVVGPHEPVKNSPTLLGTTASRIIRQTAQPVLVATGDAPDDWTGVDILVGVDFSQHALAAVKTALAWAKHLEGKVRVMYATPEFSPTTAMPNPDPALIAEIEASNRARLRDWCEEHQLAGAEHLSKPGLPVEVLLEEATSKATGLIVLGTRGHSRVSELILGSTTERVLSRAPVPVLAVEAPSSKDD